MFLTAPKPGPGRVVHRLPGRLRVELPGFLVRTGRAGRAGRADELTGELTGRLAALPGVQKVTVNPFSGRVLLYFDASRRPWTELFQDVQAVWAGLAWAGPNGPNGPKGPNGPAGPEEAVLPAVPAGNGSWQEGKAGEKAGPAEVRRCAQKAVFGGGLLAFAALKRLFSGPGGLSRSPRLFPLAAATSIVGGYPLFRRAPAASGRPPRGLNPEFVLGAAGLTFALLRNSLPGLALFWLAGLASWQLAQNSAVFNQRLGGSRAAAPARPERRDRQDRPAAQLKPDAEIDAYRRETAKNVFGLAALTGLLEKSPAKSAAMLLAANPGPGSRAASLAVGALVRQAARQEIYLRQGEMLPAFAELDTLLFTDPALLTGPQKTGELHPAPGVPRAEFAHLAAVLAGAAGHPLAELFPRPGEEDRGAVLVEEQSFLGIRGRLGDETTLTFGTAGFIRTPLPAWAAALAGQLAQQKQTPWFLLRRERLLGVIGIHYELFAGVEKALWQLRARGVETVAVCLADPTAGLALRRAGVKLISAGEAASFFPGRERTAVRAGIVQSGWKGKDELLLTLAGALPGPAKAKTTEPDPPDAAEALISAGGLAGLARLFDLAVNARLAVRENLAWLRTGNYLGLFLAAAGRLSLPGALLYSELWALGLALRALLKCRAPKEPSGRPEQNQPGRTQPGSQGPASPASPPPPLAPAPALTLLPGGKGQPGRGLLPAAPPPPPANARAAAGNGWAKMSPAAILAALQTDPERGLNPAAAGERLLRHGLNKLAESKPRGFWERFQAQLQDLMVRVLMGSTVACLFLGEIGDALAIITIVILNALLGVLQERKAEAALAALREMTAPTARVIRAGRLVEIPAAQLVPGDIVRLRPGDVVPADLRLLWAAGLEIEEAVLTGESFPAPKDPAAPAGANGLAQENPNLAFAATTVTRGQATGVVVATGMNTEIGQIAGLLQQEEPSTPLQKRLAGINRGVLLGCLGVSGLIFATGVWRGEAPFGMFLTAVSLAVAAIPEGLPAAVTVALAAGVRRMAGRKAIVRQLAGVETLGCATVICTDKTGTLTKNEQTVRTVYAGGKYSDPAESGLCADPDYVRFLQGAVLCCAGFEPAAADALDAAAAAAPVLTALPAGPGRKPPSTPSPPPGKKTGDPLAEAILAAARQAGLDPELLWRRYPREKEIPFTPERGRTTVLCREENGLGIYTKGAPEQVLALCAQYFRNGRRQPLTAEHRREILAANEKLAARALRVLAVAGKAPAGAPAGDGEDVAEEGLCFLGLAGMQDPLRAEAAEAVSRCRQAGIRVVIVTGDHPHTALAVANELGLDLPPGLRPVITGRELEKMSDGELARCLAETGIFARVLPRHKLRLVEAFQKNGQVVAMIGDGANDAPAVKKADTGVAMGLSGTDVTRGAATLVITDDNFATLVEAIRQGRGIYENIRQSVRYLLATNVGEVLLVLGTVLARLPLPLAPIHLLWLNLLGDGLPVLALGVAQPDDGVMRQPPRPREAKFFDTGYTYKIISQGLALGLAAFTSYLSSWRSGGHLSRSRTVTLCTLTLSQMLYALNCHQEQKQQGRSANPYLIGAVGLNAALLLGSLYLPGLRGIFKTWPLGLADWLPVGLGLGAGWLAERCSALFLPGSRRSRPLLERALKTSGEASAAQNTGQLSAELPTVNICSSKYT